MRSETRKKRYDENFDGAAVTSEAGGLNIVVVRPRNIKFDIPSRGQTSSETDSTRSHSNFPSKLRGDSHGSMQASLQAAVRHLVSAEKALANSQLRAAVDAAAAGLKALPASQPIGPKRMLLNTHGAALHLLGDTKQAHEQLEATLELATLHSISGGGHDAYVDLGGALIGTVKD